MIRRLLSWLFGPADVAADPACTECAGSGFDAGGLRCMCVR